MATLYEILGITPNASKEDIHKAYLLGVKKWHPDRNKAPEALDKFNAIRDAYETLSNSSKRVTYNRNHNFTQQASQPKTQSPSSNNGNYYEILGIRRSASKAEIEKAYSKVTKHYEPGNPFSKERNAYETLIDDHRRKMYDERLAFVESGRKEKSIFNGPPPKTNIWGEKLSPQELNDWNSSLEDILGDIRKNNPNLYEELKKTYDEKPEEVKKTPPPPAKKPVNNNPWSAPSAKKPYIPPKPATKPVAKKVNKPLKDNNGFIDVFSQYYIDDYKNIR